MNNAAQTWYNAARGNTINGEWILGSARVWSSEEWTAVGSEPRCKVAVVRASAPGYRGKRTVEVAEVAEAEAEYRALLAGRVKLERP